MGFAQMHQTPSTSWTPVCRRDRPQNFGPAQKEPYIKSYGWFQQNCFDYQISLRSMYSSSAYAPHFPLCVIVAIAWASCSKLAAIQILWAVITLSTLAQSRRVDHRFDRLDRLFRLDTISGYFYQNRSAKTISLPQTRPQISGRPEKKNQRRYRRRPNIFVVLGVKNHDFSTNLATLDEPKFSLSLRSSM